MQSRHHWRPWSHVRRSSCQPSRFIVAEPQEGHAFVSWIHKLSVVNRDTVLNNDNQSLLDNIKWKILKKTVNNLAMLHSSSASDIELFCESVIFTIHLSVGHRAGSKSAFGMTLKIYHRFFIYSVIHNLGCIPHQVIVLHLGRSYEAANDKHWVILPDDPPVTKNTHVAGIPRLQQELQQFLQLSSRTTRYITSR
jgi:hypothetical protein